MRFSAVYCGLAVATLCLGGAAQGAANPGRSKPASAKKDAKKGKKPAVVPLTPPPTVSPAPLVAQPSGEESATAVVPLVKPASQQGTPDEPAPAVAPLVPPAPQPATHTVEAYGSAPAQPAPVASLQPAPAEVATAPAPAAVATAQAPAAEWASFHATPQVGFGYTGESATGPNTPAFDFGLALEYAFTRDASLSLSARDQLYRRTYLTTRPDLELQGAAQTELDEQKVSADLLFAYELPGLFGFETEGLRMALLVGPSMRLFLNESMPSKAGAVALGGRISWALSPSLDVGAHGLWGYNLLFKNADLLSALGGPKACSSYGASLGLRLAPGTRLGLGYEGEALVLASSVRLYHSMAFVFDVAL